MSKRRRMSDGAFPPADPSPTGNYEQRRAWNAIQLKKRKALRKAAAKELKLLPPKVRELIRRKRELEETVERMGDVYGKKATE